MENSPTLPHCFLRCSDSIKKNIITELSKTLGICYKLIECHIFKSISQYRLIKKRP